MSVGGHTKEKYNDDDGFIQFEVKCFGEGDKKKYYVVDAFGSAYVPPVDSRGVTIKSSNKDVSYFLGVLNKIEMPELNNGEKIIFSTDEAGQAIVSQMVLRNNGDIEINKDLDNATVIIGVDGSLKFESNGTWHEVDGDFDVTATGDATIIVDGVINLNGDADNAVGFSQLKTGFDSLKKSLTDLTTAFNTHMHATAAVGPPSPPTPLPPNIPALPPTASIDASKKDNIKTE